MRRRGDKSPRVLAAEFRPVAESSFRFLVDDYGYGTPYYGDEVLPNLKYIGTIISYQVGYDPLDRAASVLVIKGNPEGVEAFRVSIRDVVSRAGEVPPDDRRVRDVRELTDALMSLAQAVRTYHPILETPQGDDLLRSPTWHRDSL